MKRKGKYNKGTFSSTTPGKEIRIKTIRLSISQTLYKLHLRIILLIKVKVKPKLNHDIVVCNVSGVIE